MKLVPAKTAGHAVVAAAATVVAAAGAATVVAVAGAATVVAAVAMAVVTAVATATVVAAIATNPPNRTFPTTPQRIPGASSRFSSLLPLLALCPFHLALVGPWSDPSNSCQLLRFADHLAEQF